MLSLGGIVRLSVLVFILGIYTSGRSVGKNFLWFPKDDGHGWVPAFLNSTEQGLVAPAGNPDDIHFYLFTQSANLFLKSITLRNFLSAEMSILLPILETIRMSMTKSTTHRRAWQILTGMLMLLLKSLRTGLVAASTAVPVQQ